MASGRDVREMLGLPMGGDAPKAAIQKRPKAVGATKKIRTSAIALSRAYGLDKNVD
jgi:DNA methyltransferase 1-associated protein 1